MQFILFFGPVYNVPWLIIEDGYEEKSPFIVNPGLFVNTLMNSFWYSM